MIESNNKPGVKFAKIRGFFIMMLGVVFFTAGNVINKRSGDLGFNAIKGLGIAAIAVGFGLQVWEIGRKKKV